MVDIKKGFFILICFVLVLGILFNSYLINNDFDIPASEIQSIQKKVVVSGWWDASFDKRISIGFDNSASSENLVDFPVLVVLNSGRIDYANTRNNGEDIRFVDSDGVTVLSHEIETWDESGSSYVWVKVPQIDAGSDTDFIHMYYDNPGALDAQDITGVWSNGYEVVWHLNENPAGTAPQIKDSTSTGHDASSIGSMTSSDSVPFIIGKGLDFDGSNDGLITSPKSPEPVYTFEAWVNRDVVNAGHDILRIHNGLNPIFVWRVLTSNSVGVSVNYNGGGGQVSEWESTGKITANTNNYLAIVHDATLPTNDPVLYLNSLGETMTQMDTGSGTAPNLNAASWDLANGKWNGRIDEVRMSNVLRSANWIRASRNSQIDQMNTYGLEESQGGSPPPGDVTAPQWSNQNTRTIIAGEPIEHSVQWADDTALSGYIFSFDNGTGTFVNDSFVSMTGTQDVSSVTKTVTSVVGSTVRWRVFASDSAGNVGATDIFSYTVVDPLLFYSTIDNSASVSSPVVGAGTGSFISTTPSNDFIAGQTGNGNALRADQSGEHVRWAQKVGNVQNIENSKGTVEFLYQPGYDHDDGKEYMFFQNENRTTGNPTTPAPGSLEIGKHNAGNLNTLMIIYWDASNTRWESTVDSSDYSWNAGDWVKIRVTWDWTAAPGVQNVHAYINSVEVPVRGRDPGDAAFTGPKTYVDENVSRRIYLGGQQPGSSWLTNGIVDELKIWGTVVSPSSAPSPDTTPPTITITSPLNNSNVSGTISITADASDDISVSGVQFKIDGNNIGAEDTTAPYSISLDTLALLDGLHTITATARDTSNNIASSNIVVNVENVNLAPAVIIDSNFFHGNSPLTIQFQGIAFDPDNNIDTYFWNFGDGTTSTSQNPSKVYSSPGVYIVQFTVTDTLGLQSSASVTVLVL